MKSRDWVEQIKRSGHGVITGVNAGRVITSNRMPVPARDLGSVTCSFMKTTNSRLAWNHFGVKRRISSATIRKRRRFNGRRGINPDDVIREGLTSHIAGREKKMRLGVVNSPLEGTES